MVEVRLPRNVKGSKLLEKLEESAKELGYRGYRDNRGGYAMVPGSAKEKLIRTKLNIKVYTKQKQYSNNWWGRFKKFLFERADFTCTIPITLDHLYRKGEGVDFDVRLYESKEHVKTGTKGWEEIRGDFGKLIDKLYARLGEVKNERTA